MPNEAVEGGDGEEGEVERWRRWAEAPLDPAVSGGRDDTAQGALEVGLGAGNLLVGAAVGLLAGAVALGRRLCHRHPRNPSVR
jgi:hypothetical protein